MKNSEANSIIRRAAAALKKQGHACTTPGCTYKTTYRNNTISCEITLPKAASIGTTLANFPYLGKHYDDYIHDMLQNAIVDILASIKAHKNVRGTGKVKP